MLIKVSCGAEQRRQLSDLAEIFRGTVCDVSPTTITLEMQGKEDKMYALQQLLQPYGKPYNEYTLFFRGQTVHDVSHVVRLKLIITHW
jgi:acetolactate synthase small subunit